MKQLNISTPQNTLNVNDIVQIIAPLNRLERENIFLEKLLEGHVPYHMRSLHDLTITFLDKNKLSHTLTIFYLPDYLCLGNDSNYFRVPLFPVTAQKVCDAWNCIMPTTMLVTLLWNGVTQKLPPQPWGPPYDASMMSTNRIIAHNDKINATIKKMNFDATKPLVGHKKDVVITNKLLKSPKQVAIYGWHQANKKPIQPLYLGHESQYSDYSHGIRLILKECLLDGQVDDLTRIAQDSILHTSISTEGPLSVIKQPAV